MEERTTKEGRKGRGIRVEGGTDSVKSQGIEEEGEQIQRRGGSLNP